MPRLVSHPPRIEPSVIVEKSNKGDATQIDDNIYEGYAEKYAWTYLMTVHQGLSEVTIQ